MTGLAATLSLRIANRMAELTAAMDAVETFLASWRVDAGDTSQVMIIVDEIASNIIKSAWPGGGEHSFTVALRVGSQARGLGLELEAVDDGVAFDPTEVAPPDLDAVLEDREVGGLGLFMVGEMSDSMVYAREDGLNRLTVTKLLQRREEWPEE